MSSKASSPKYENRELTFFDPISGILLPAILTVLFWILSIYLSVVNKEDIVLSALDSLYTPGENNWFLVAVVSVTWILGYFMLVITWANFSDIIQARKPGWGVVFWSAIITLLVAFSMTFVVPADIPLYKNAEGLSITNFTSAMRWTMMGVVLLGIVLLTLYLVSVSQED